MNYDETIEDLPVTPSDSFFFFFSAKETPRKFCVKQPSLQNAEGMTPPGKTRLVGCVFNRSTSAVQVARSV